MCATISDMVKKTAGSIRARVREEMITGIKQAARRQIATEGASLSLRAVARELGMVSSALYRYFPSRDDLLTALIIDAYNALGDAAEKAEAAIEDRSDFLGRWLAVTHGIRRWALKTPHEYALIYGSPVPGYAAPQDTVEPSTRPVLVMGAILADAAEAGRLLTEQKPAPLHPMLGGEIALAAELVDAKVPAEVMARGLIAWTELFGAINFELFGRIDNVIDERDEWFDYQARAMARFVGLS